MQTLKPVVTCKTNILYNMGQIKQGEYGNQKNDFSGLTCNNPLNM